MLNGTLRSYLAYSAAAHAALLLVLALVLLRGAASPRSEVYRIDFIGPSAGILNRELESSARAAAAPAKAVPPASGRIAPQSHPDDFNLRKRSRRPLPKPSLLASPAERVTAVESAPAAKAAPAAAAGTEETAKAAPGGASAGGEGAGASASISADMPNFPYPWYLTRLRGLLWNQWSSRVPEGAAECAVSFSILRDGRLVDLRVESTSGDSSFDYAALSSVQGIAPFPPLPDGFREAFLKVHVQFKR